MYKKINFCNFFEKGESVSGQDRTRDPGLKLPMLCQLRDILNKFERQNSRNEYEYILIFTTLYHNTLINLHITYRRI